MFTHTIAFVILSILSATAAYAAGTPVSKSSPEQHQSGTSEKEGAADKESSDSL